MTATLDGLLVAFCFLLLPLTLVGMAVLLVTWDGH
jgi:hypothetical protein